MNMQILRSAIIRTMIVAVILIVALWWAGSNIDLAHIAEAFAKANYFYALLTIPIVLISHGARAWRWRTLLTPVVGKRSFWNMFSAIMVGYAANNIIPRSGEVLRPIVYSKREDIPLSTVIASVVVERFIDIINLLIFLSIALYFVGNELQAVLPDISLTAITRTVALTCITFLIVILLAVTTSFGEWCINTIIRKLSGKIADKILDMYVSFRKGLAIISQPSEYVRLLAESLFIWLCYVLPMYVMFYAMIFTDSAGLVIHLGFLDACVILLVMALGTTIAPTPGAIGVVHALVSAVMVKLYGVQKEDALAYVTLAHALNYLSVIIVGGLCMLRENVRPTMSGKLKEANSLTQSAITNTEV
jgi:glycosyltransferase 2 family protein